MLKYAYTDTHLLHQRCGALSWSLHVYCHLSDTVFIHVAKLQKTKQRLNCEHTKLQTDKFYYRHQGGFSLIQFVWRIIQNSWRRFCIKNVFTEVQAWPNLVPINFWSSSGSKIFVLKDSSGLQQRPKLVISSQIHITVLSSHMHIT